MDTETQSTQKQLMSSSFCFHLGMVDYRPNLFPIFRKENNNSGFIFKNVAHIPILNDADLVRDVTFVPKCYLNTD